MRDRDGYYDLISLYNRLPLRIEVLVGRADSSSWRDQIGFFGKVDFSHFNDYHGYLFSFNLAMMGYFCWVDGFYLLKLLTPLDLSCLMRNIAHLEKLGFFGLVKLNLDSLQWGWDLLCGKNGQCSDLYLCHIGVMMCHFFRLVLS